MKNVIKLCLKDSYDPCPWRRKRDTDDGVNVSKKICRCSSTKGCVWEYWAEVTKETT